MIPKDNPVLSNAEKKQLLILARAAIESAMEGGHPPIPEDLSPPLREEHPCFVSLHLHGKLRGCIGSLEAKEPLYRNVINNAFNAAFKDPRFPPLTEKELTQTRIEVSVLTPAREIASSDDFIVGLHGIILEADGRRAVFLPQVAPQQNWDRQTTLNHLARKAGLPEEAWRRPNARLKVFESMVFSE